MGKKVNGPRVKSDGVWWVALSVVALVALVTRLHKVLEPDHVCWDETHFGKMGSWYINRTFFFDVHPPLGKMLIGLSGRVTGYNGTFPFTKPGDKYLDHNYAGMRIFCAVVGSLVVPFSFVSTFDLSRSLPAACLAASFITFDVGFVTISQYILLDPILMFFISGSFMGSVKVMTWPANAAFSWQWWFWLTWTGIFLSSAVSVKFVGLFIVMVVGIQTIFTLWQLLADLSLTMLTIAKHFLARIALLIVLPVLLYILFFWIHLTVLSKSGTGDGFFSSAFQSQLEGNSLFNASMPREVAYGAVISLKNVKTGGGYLHSHWHLYPEAVGARQQQVTGYSHKDENNKWIIKKYDSEPSPDGDVELVQDGDLIRLEHEVTRRNLHSHNEVAPVTKRHYQVTCYGENGAGDANDVWRLQLENSAGDPLVKTVTSNFRLIHYFVSCALSCNTVQLPKWGFEQMEVTCNPNLNDRATLWNIEDNVSKLPNVSFTVFAPSFLDKFLESHAVMFHGNSGLKPKEGEVTSRPWQWPINLRGQFFSGSEYKVYLLGNPVIWWTNSSLLLVYFLIQITICVRVQRNAHVPHDLHKANSRLTTSASWLFIAWLIHYLPFFAMGRVLYYHHYFPAAIFSSCLSAVLLDYFLVQLPPVFHLSPSVAHFAIGTIVAIVVYSFYIFSPLAYGIITEAVPDSNVTVSNSMESLKWLESWEF